MMISLICGKNKKLVYGFLGHLSSKKRAPKSIFEKTSI